MSQLAAERHRRGVKTKRGYRGYARRAKRARSETETLTPVLSIVPLQVLQQAINELKKFTIRGALTGKPRTPAFTPDFEGSFSRLTRGAYGEDEGAWQAEGAVSWLLNRVAREHDLDTLSAASAVLKAAAERSRVSLSEVVGALSVGEHPNRIDVCLRALRWVDIMVMKPVLAELRKRLQTIVDQHDDEDLQDSAKRLLDAVAGS